MEKIIVTPNNFVNEKSNEIIKYIKKNADNGLNKTTVSFLGEVMLGHHLRHCTPIQIQDVIEAVCECVVSKLENVTYKRSTPHFYFVFIVN